MHKAIYFKVLEYAPENLDLIRCNFDLVVLDNPDSLTEELLSTVEVLFAPLGYRFDSELMSRCPRLKIIATNTTGVPHIDTKYAGSAGIRVLSLKDEQGFLRTITPTAELTIGLMISITRNVMPAIAAVRDGRWRRWDFGGPAMLSRMSLGICGLGRLGEMVARYACAMGMRVSYYDPYIAQPPAGTPYMRSDSLARLVADSDIVSIHVPMTPENRFMFNAPLLSLFKQGAYLINTARGELVDSDALVYALESGHLAGAALDVLDGEFEAGFESRVNEHPLVKYAREHDNLIITPHIAGSTRDAWYMTQRHTIDQAIQALGAA